MLVSIQLGKKYRENAALCVCKLKFQLSGQKRWAFSVNKLISQYLFVELIEWSFHNREIYIFMRWSYSVGNSFIELH